jgi:hypothetical protein
MFLTDITGAANKKFEQDVRFLNQLFGTIDNIEACAVVVAGRDGRTNYSQRFGDPDKEKTLRIVSRTDVVLFYEHSVKNVYPIEVCDGVTMVDNFSFAKGYKVDNYMYRPVELPYYLESFIYQCVDEAMSAMRISRKSFFERNFKRGGMMPIKEMRGHPEWKEKYLDDAEVKDVHMCKSCLDRSHSGCCPEYSASNRKKVRMAIGWHV